MHRPQTISATLGRCDTISTLYLYDAALPLCRWALIRVPSDLVQVLSIAEHGVADEGNSHELEVLAHAIAGLRANLCIRPSLFAAGPVARKVSQLMHGLPTWPQPLSGTSPHAAALVLVDRAVDLSIVMEVPHTVAGLAGKMADPVVSSGKAGSVATTWWQEAAGRDDGFAAAEMVLQDVLPETLYHSGVLAAHSDLTARFLSGQHQLQSMSSDQDSIEFGCRYRFRPTIPESMCLLYHSVHR